MRRAAILACAVGMLSMGFVMPSYQARRRPAQLPVVVLDPGHVYPTINISDCIPWPNAEWKSMGGVSAWKGWSVPKGEQGIAIARASHCLFPETTVVFVEFGPHRVPIGSKGLRFEWGSSEDLPLLTKPSTP